MVHKLLCIDEVYIYYLHKLLCIDEVYVYYLPAYISSQYYIHTKQDRRRVAYYLHPGILTKRR